MTDTEKRLAEAAREFLDADQWLVRIKSPANFDRKRKARKELEAALAEFDRQGEEEQ